MTAAAPWTCPTCIKEVSTPFCPACGEHPLRPRHLTLHDLADQLFVAFSSIDGKLLRSLRTLLINPGALTVAYVQGKRKPYLGPLGLFLIANAVFFAMQSFAHSDIFASPLGELGEKDWGTFGQALVAAHVKALRITPEAYAHRFDPAVFLNAKALIILMALGFSGVLAAVVLPQRRPIAAHAIFALHLYAFLLLLFCTSLAIGAASRALGGPGLEAQVMDTGVSLLNLAVYGGYLYAAVGRVYGLRGIGRIARAVVLAIVVFALVPLYSFTVFLITLYTT